MSAEDNYYYYKNKEATARENKNYYKDKRDECKGDLKDTKAAINDEEKEKKNLEKRLEGVISIIGMLEGTSSKNNVVEKISDARTASVAAGDKFTDCIVCSDITAASLSTKFNTKSVTNDTNSNNALAELKREKSRLETAIAEIDRNVRNLQARVESLTRNINTYDDYYEYYKDKEAEYKEDKKYWKKKMNDD